MIDLLTDPHIIMSFLTLAVLEIVLGVDNLLFVQIIAARVRPERRMFARRVGLAFALLTRLALLASISWIASLTTPIWSINWPSQGWEFDLSWRDIILLAGGLFLLAKATTEIHHSIEGKEEADHPNKSYLGLASAIVQIAILDIVFSLDSVITAVGMTNELPIMVAAVVAAMIVMIFAAGSVGNFVDRHPSVKMLCLAFLLMVGLALLGEGLGFHIPKGYLYFSIAFSALVEALNLWAKARREAAAAKAS